MDIPSVDLRSLRYAMALARHENFHRAAESLSISQPALTKSIGNLEQVLGVRLFDRLRQRVEPTAYGEVLLDSAADIFQRLEDMSNRLQRISTVPRGTLSIGIGHYFAYSIFSAKISEFIAKNPAQRINIIQEDWKSLLQMLREGDIQLFIADANTLNKMSDLAIHKIASIKPVLICRGQHPLASKERIQFEDIQGFPLALAFFHVDDSLKQVFWEFSGSAEIADMEKYLGRTIRTTCNSYSILRDVILSSDQLTLGSDTTFSEDIAEGRMVALNTDITAPGAGQACVVTLKGRTLPPSADKLIHLLRTITVSAQT